MCLDEFLAKVKKYYHISITKNFLTFVYNKLTIFVVSYPIHPLKCLKKI
jgi:hypothetical protein